jgi:hypothetical protein
MAIIFEANPDHRAGPSVLGHKVGLDHCVKVGLDHCVEPVVLGR